MRYFRRSGPDVIWQETPARARLVKGPGDDQGRVAYDETYPDEANWANQLATSPGWYEVDRDDKPTFYRPPKPVEDVPLGPPPDVSVGDQGPEPFVPATSGTIDPDPDQTSEEPV